MSASRLSNPDLPDRIKAKLTIDLDFAKDDQPRIGEVLQRIIENLGISNEGDGSCTPHSHYRYKLETNLPQEPMTVERLFDLFDEAREPGEPSSAELLAESLHPDFDQAQAWWERLSDAQRNWFVEKFPTVKLVTKAWEVHRDMDFADRAFFQALSQSS